MTHKSTFQPPRLRREIGFWIVRGLIALFRVLPRRMALAAGGAIGRLVPVIARKDYRLAVEHLSIAFPDLDPPAVNRLARAVFHNAALNFIDTVRLEVMTDEEVVALVVPHHLERLDAAYAAGRGVVSLSAHLGCWELMGRYYTATGRPTAAISRSLYDDRFEDMLVKQRRDGGIVNITRGRDTREIIRLLREGYQVGMLIDQDMKVKGEFVPFFGRPSHTAIAPAQLSLRYGAPIVPMFTWRDADNRHHIWVGEPLTIEPSGDTAADITALTAACSRATEEAVRRHPEQWVWFHRRWKTRPASEGGRDG